MEKLTTLTGVAVPLRRSNVDTDQIIPAVFLKRVKKSGAAFCDFPKACIANVLCLQFLWVPLRSHIRQKARGESLL